MNWQYAIDTISIILLQESFPTMLYAILEAVSLNSLSSGCGLDTTMNLPILDASSSQLLIPIKATLVLLTYKWE